MHLRHVNAKHKIARAELEDEPAHFFAGMLDPCRHAIVAYDEGKIVGWLRYTRHGRHTFYAAGTWVEPEYRGRELAQRLWRHALRRETPRRVMVTTVSDGGRRLIGALLPQFPRVAFQVN